LTFAHNPGAGLYKGLIIVGISAELSTGGAAPTGVTHNGDTMTLLSSQTNGAVNVSIWYRVAPDAAGNVVATFAAAMDGIVGGAVTYYGVHQTTPFGTPVTATGSSTTAAVSAILAATVDTVFAAAVSAGGSAGTPGGALDNEHWDVTCGGVGHTGLGGDAMDVAASNAVQWSALDNAAWAIIGVAIKPADVAATPKVFTKSVTTPPVGAYRVLARILGNGGGLGVAMGYAYGGVTQDPSVSTQYAAILTATTVWHILDIGSIIIPPATLPDGATIGTLTLRLCAYRTSGSTGANLDVDWVMLLPVDYGSSYAAKTSAADVVVIDTISRAPTLALWNTSDVFQSRPAQEGSPPMIDPDGTRLYFCFDDGVDATISDGANIAIRIVPCHMLI